MSPNVTTPGRLLVNSLLPPDLRSESDRLDKKTVTKLFNALANKYPDDYPDILRRMSELGFRFASETGNTLSIYELRNDPRRQALADELEDKVQRLRDEIDDPAKFKIAVVALANQYTDKFKELSATRGKELNGPLYEQVTSGARGNIVQYNSMTGADVLVSDHKNDPVPFPIVNNYSQGMTPAEYYASLYGTRKGLIDTKMCKPSGTKILLPDLSYKEIQDIRPGEFVMGATIEGKLIPVKVLNLFDNGMQDCFRYSFRRFASREETLEFEATENHKILSEIRSPNFYRSDYTPKKRKLEEAKVFRHIRKNEFYATAPSGACDTFLGYNEPAALLIGLMLEDGCTRGSQYHISCADLSLIDDITSYLDSLGLYLKKSSNYDWCIKSVIPSKPVVLRDAANRRIASTRTTDKLKLRFMELGLHKELAHNKAIPREVFTSWSIHSIRQLLAGIFSSDACISKRRRNGIDIKLCLSSKQLIEDIYNLLNFRLGIGTTKIARIDKSSSRFAKHDQYVISIQYLSYIKEFASTIKLVGVKRKQLEKVLADSDYKDRKPGHKFLGKVPIGRKQTYDLEVDHPDHLYVLYNGIITSNSIGDAGYYAKRLANSLHRLVVTDDTPIEQRLPVGFPREAMDPDAVGTVLSIDVGPYKKGTIITPKISGDLPNYTKKILTYSPITSITSGGGLDRLSAGVRERGGLPEIGDNVGLASATSISEPMSQNMLNCLEENTLVRMADFTTKKIKDIKVGDRVLGADKKGNIFPTNVTYIFDQGLQSVNSYKFRASSLVRLIEVNCTSNHKFLSRNSNEVLLKSAVNNGEPEILPIAYKEHIYRVQYNRRGNLFICAPAEPNSYLGQRRCFDIEVDHEDHLFVLANGLICSNSKHTAGVGTKKVAKGGFKYLDDLVQFPETFIQAGPLAKTDGFVDKIVKAPQGGHYIYINKEEHYVPGHLNVTVKPNQKIEQGDDICDGIPHPAELVKYRGLGEARRVYYNIFKEALDETGVPSSPRNIEAVAAGLLNHIRVTNPEGMGDYLPDDSINYSRVFSNYKPREGSQLTPIKQAYGKYLEEPALHYTIGTRVNRKVIKDLQDFGLQEINTHHEKPGFEPFVQRNILALDADEDWQSRLAGFYVSQGFTDSVARGSISDTSSTSYIPAVANPVELGKKLKETGKY